MSTVAERIIAGFLRANRQSDASGRRRDAAGDRTGVRHAVIGRSRAIAGILLQVAAVFLVGGAAATYLSHTERRCWPNERVTTDAHARPAVGGWLMALVAALLAAPVLLLLRMQPFLAEWRRVIELASAPGLWDNANANMSGVVLMPIFAALTPPFFELATLMDSWSRR
jgi:hypothetical protein